MGFLSKLFGGKRRVSLAEIRRSFDEAAGDEEHFPSTIDPRIQHVKLVLRHMGDVDGKAVLDLGAGKGRFARIVAAEHTSARVIALDLSENMLRHVPRPVLPCSATMTDLPFRTDTFEGAYATESLEHAVDIERAVAEMCRVVRPGGRILIIDKNAAHWGKLKTPAWERWFHQRELESLLGRHCASVRSEPISYWEDVAPDGLFLAWMATK